MLPARAAPRLLTVWSRLCVLGGFGLFLLLPVFQLGWDALQRNRPTLARETASQFLHAYVQNDPQALAAVLTNGADRFAAGLGADLVMNPRPAIVVGEPSVADTDAEVPFVLDREKGTIQMAWQGNAWRVRALIFPQEENGGGPLIDYAELATRQKYAAEVKAHAALAPLDARKFDRFWRESVQAQAQPAGSLLRRGIRSSGLSLLPRSSRRVLPFAPAKGTGSREPWEDTPITLTMRNRSRLEIIDAVARKASIELRQTDSSLKVCSAEDHPVVAYAGPFRVEVVRLTEDQRHCTGSLTLRALGLKLPDSVLAAMTGYSPHLPDPQVRGADGRDFYHSDRRDRVPLPKLSGPFRK